MTASEYDIKIEQWIPKYQEMQEAIVSVLPFERSASIKVLDLGIGTGNLSLCLLQQFPRARVTGIDTDDEMLEVASRKLRVLKSRVQLMKGDFGNSLPAGKYDAIISCLSIHHLTDSQKTRLFRKSFSSLAVGGAFVNGDFVVSDSGFVNRKNAEAEMKFLKSQGVSEPGLLLLGGQLGAEDDFPATVDSQVRWLRQAGFTETDCVWKYLYLAVFMGLKQRSRSIEQ